MVYETSHGTGDTVPRTGLAVAVQVLVLYLLQFSHCVLQFHIMNPPRQLSRQVQATLNCQSTIMDSGNDLARLQRVKMQKAQVQNIFPLVARNLDISTTNQLVIKLFFGYVYIQC